MKAAATTWGRRSVVAALAAAAAGARGALQLPELEVALVPYLSSRAMLAVFDPLRRHLEVAHGRPVAFYTASSFAALLESVRQKRQPFTYMPMHLARIAVADWGHTLAARSTRESLVRLLAPRSLGISGTAALRGRTIGAIDPLSVTTLMLRRWLAGQKLQGAVQVVNLPSTNAAALALGRGDVDLMVAAQGQALDIPWLKPDELVPVATLGSVLTPCFVALRDVAADELAVFRQALLSFAAPGGARGASTASYVEGSPGDLEPYESYAAEVRRQLQLR